MNIGRTDLRTVSGVGLGTNAANIKCKLAWGVECGMRPQRHTHCAETFPFAKGGRVLPGLEQQWKVRRGVRVLALSHAKWTETPVATKIVPQVSKNLQLVP